MSRIYFVRVNPPVNQATVSTLRKVNDRGTNTKGSTRLSFEDHPDRRIAHGAKCTGGIQNVTQTRS